MFISIRTRERDERPGGGQEVPGHGGQARGPAHILQCIHVSSSPLTQPLIILENNVVIHFMP